MASSKKPASKAKATKAKPPGRKERGPTQPKAMTPNQRRWVAAMVEHGGHHPTVAEAVGISSGQSRNIASQPEFRHVQKALEDALDAVDEAAKESAVWTRERLISKFEEVVDLSLGLVPNDEGFLKPNLRAACTALAEIGKLSGFYTTKLEHKGKLTMAELMASYSEEEIDGG